ncbi:hypothetical protein ACLOJK_020644 [Asimina triloba]
MLSLSLLFLINEDVMGDDFVQLTNASRGSKAKLSSELMAPDALYERGHIYLSWQAQDFMGFIVKVGDIRGKRDKPHLALFIKSGREDSALKTLRGGAKRGSPGLLSFRHGDNSMTCRVDTKVSSVKDGNCPSRIENCNCGVEKGGVSGIIATETIRMIRVIIVKGKTEDDGVEEDPS